MKNIVSRIKILEVEKSREFWRESKLDVKRRLTQQFDEFRNVKEPTDTGHLLSKNEEEVECEVFYILILI